MVNEITAGHAVFAHESTVVYKFSAAATDPVAVAAGNEKLLPAINAAAHNGTQVVSGSRDTIVKTPKWTTWVMNDSTPLEDKGGEAKYGAFIEVTYKLTVTASSQGLGDYQITFTKGSDYDTSGVGENMIILYEAFGSAYSSGVKKGGDDFNAIDVDPADGTTVISLPDESTSGVYYFRVLAWIDGTLVANNDQTALNAEKQILVATASYQGD